MPVVPSCLLEPVWVEFYAVLNDARGGEPPEFDRSHPLGCHRRRIDDRVVFEHVIDALVHGSGYERIATRACSDRTIRRRLTQWAALGIAERVHAAALRAYDLIIGLELVSADDTVHTSLERSQPSPAGMIPLTCNEIRRLINTRTRPPDPTHYLRWSTWRRQHQHTSRLCHYTRRERNQP